MNSRILLTTAAFLAAGALGHAATATENWENHCTKCHGADGKGQTKIGKKLNLKDYTSEKFQAQFTDDQLLKAIADGVVVDGKEKMKGYKDQLSQQDMTELVGYIRKFKK